MRSIRACWREKDKESLRAALLLEEVEGRCLSRMAEARECRVVEAVGKQPRVSERDFHERKRRRGEW